MDIWSEDSSDEFVRAEQEAALYSAVHYTSVEAENNSVTIGTASTPSSKPSQISATRSLPNLGAPKTTNITSVSASIGANRNISRFFGNLPKFLEVLGERSKKPSCETKTASATGKAVANSQIKSVYFDHLSHQLSKVPSLVNLENDRNAPSLKNPGSQYLSSKKTEIPLQVHENKSIEDQRGFSAGNSTKVKAQLPASNSPQIRLSQSANAVEMASTTQKNIFNSNPNEIKTFSFTTAHQELSDPLCNNLFSPFNAQYLKTKTSCEKVFRLDEHLFSDEKKNLHKTAAIHAPLERDLGLVAGQSKPSLVQESSTCNSTGAENISQVVLQTISTNAAFKETEIQKTFVFDLSHSVEGSKKITSPPLPLLKSVKTNLFSPFAAKCGQNPDQKQILQIKPQKSISVLTKLPADNILPDNKPSGSSKLPKKTKTKKKVKILKSNVIYNSLVNLKRPPDKVMVIGIKSPDSLCDVIVLDKDIKIKSIDPDVIILDSDSDESVHVVPLPAAPLPLIISVEDSSDDDHVVRLQPAVVVPFETDPDVAENSFDFLDNVIETCMGDFDGIRKAQANVLSNLISNHSSKESLVDERLFQVEPAVPESEVPKKAVELPYQEDNVSSSTSSMSPLHENTHNVQFVGNVESGSDNGEPPHSFKVPKAKVRTKSKQAKNTTKPLEVSNVIKASDDDILVVHSGTKSTITIEEILSGETNKKRIDQETTEFEPEILNRKRKREESKNKDVAKKKKSPGRKKRAKAEKNLRKFLRSQPQSNLFSYTKIAGEPFVSVEKTPPPNPPSWTKDMKKFYNSSWGGEEHDWKKIKSSMSGNPYAWQVSNEDRYPNASRGRPARCRQCQRSGHFAWACPDIRVGSRCRMCGQTGHVVKDCPNGICMKCGQPSRGFVKCCWQCKGSPFGECALCVWQHNPAHPCKNYRDRPAHASSAFNSPQAGYKGYRQRYGSNQPADRGYSPYYNKNFSRRPFR